MRNVGSICIVFAVLLLSGCASLRSVSMTSIPAQRSKPVSSEVSRWVFLGLAFDNDFVEPIVDQLKKQCPHGKVSGILTKDELYDYFLYLIVQRRVTARGYCETTI